MKVFFLCFILLLTSIIQAKPITKFSFRYYEIYPTTKQDLAREMLKRSPAVKNGNTFSGYTSWHVSWNFNWKKRDGFCKITKVKTKLNVLYTMPRLLKSQKVENEVRESFEDYYSALFEHEKGHMKFGLLAAKDIEKAILNLGALKSCNALENSANTVGKKIIRKYNKLEREYDIETNHGKRDGVDINNYI